MLRKLEKYLLKNRRKKMFEYLKQKLGIPLLYKKMDDYWQNDAQRFLDMRAALATQKIEMEKIKTEMALIKATNDHMQKLVQDVKISEKEQPQVHIYTDKIKSGHGIVMPKSKK